MGSAQKNRCVKYDGTGFLFIFKEAVSMQPEKGKRNPKGEKERRRRPVFCVTLLPPAQEEKQEEWLCELEREAANVIRGRLQ